MNERASMTGAVRCVPVVVVLAVALLSSCASRPFNVRVVPRVESEAISPPASSGPLVVRADAMWEEEWSFENLDANAPLAGVLPVRLELENTSGAPLDAKRLDISAADAAGHVLARLDAKKARKTIETYYGITIRSKSGDEAYKKDFAANAIDLRTPLAAGERRQGLLFLRLPGGSAPRIRIQLVVASKRAGVRVETALD